MRSRSSCCGVPGRRVIGARRYAPSVKRRSSHAPTAARSPGRSDFRPWLPRRRTTSRPGASGGMPNGSRLALDDSTGTVTASSSPRRVFSGGPRRVQREGQAQDAGGAGRRGGAAGDARAGGAPAGDERQPAQRVAAQRAPRPPSRPRRAGGPGPASAGPPRGRAARRARRARRRRRAPGRRTRSGAATPPPAPWPSTSSAARAVGRVQVGPRRAVRRLEARAAPRFSSLRRRATYSACDVQGLRQSGSRGAGAGARRAGERAGNAPGGASSRSTTRCPRS